MLKNDYRRALILLRPLEKGLSGHLRLERRTLTAMLRFTVIGSGRGRLQAVLLAPDQDGYKAHALGALGTDSRGQSGMTVNVDPRNLSGKALEQYDIVALLRTGDGEPEICMTGMMNGAREINWQKARAAATEPFRKTRTPQSEKAEKPRQETRVPETRAAREEADEEAERCEEIEEIERDDRDEISQGEAEARDTPEKRAAAQAGSEEAEKAETETAPPSEHGADLCKTDDRAILPEPTASELGEDADEETPPNAAERLGLDMTQPWPEEIESLRALFQTETAFEPFRLADFVFVEAPLPDENGGDGVCAIGLRAEDGRPASVCYALPGPYAVEPPPGLEGYTYLGGWWYTILEPVTDDPLPADNGSPRSPSALSPN